MKHALFVLALAVPTAALPCTLLAAPSEVSPIGFWPPTQTQTDGGTDSAAPATPVLSGLELRLFEDGCDGSGSSCPQLDLLRFKVESSDDATAAEDLRYAFYLTESEETARTRATPDILVAPDIGQPAQISAYLGLNGARDGQTFSKARVCFTVVAVDQTGKVSERSNALCADTLDKSASYAQVQKGTPCASGCSAAAVGAHSLLGLLTLLLAVDARKRRR